VQKLDGTILGECYNGASIDGAPTSQALGKGPGAGVGWAGQDRRNEIDD
jgi:hypothetical protein